MCACVINLDICFSFQFDEEFLNKQEAQTQLVKCEEKIAELQAELQAFRSQVQDPYFFVCNVNFCKLCLLFKGCDM